MAFDKRIAPSSMVVSMRHVSDKNALMGFNWSRQLVANVG